MRRLIREKIVDIITGIGFTGEPVTIYNDRKMPINTLPAVIVYSAGDSVEDSASEQALTRTEIIYVHVYAINEIDEIVEQIEERLIGSYQTLVGSIYRLKYMGSTIDHKIDGEDLIVSVRMEFSAKWIMNL